MGTALLASGNVAKMRHDVTFHASPVRGPSAIAPHTQSPKGAALIGEQRDVTTRCSVGPGACVCCSGGWRTWSEKLSCGAPSVVVYCVAVETLQNSNAWICGLTMGLVEDLIIRYARESNFYDQAARLAAQMLDGRLQAAGVRSMVTSRAKSAERLRPKLAERAVRKNYLTISDIYDDIVDPAGVRVSLQD